MYLNTLNDFFQKASEIIKEHERKLDAEGLRFNIFSILNLQSKEVRLHSNFIGELINPKGVHTFGNIFFKLFLQEIIHTDSRSILFNFNTGNYVVEIEKYIGIISKDSRHGGRIDIIITDNNKNQIIIENKIFANDQRYQLLRYYNYNPNAHLLYLTLNGMPPSLASTNNEIKRDEDFFCIAYKSTIVNWLEKCLKICSEKPRIQSTITQYLNIIQDYTDQNINSLKMNNLVNLLSENKAFFTSVEDIYSAYNILRYKINDDFIHELKGEIPNKTIYTLKDDWVLNCKVEKDLDEFFFGVYLEKEGVKIEMDDNYFDEYHITLLEINDEYVRNGY